MKSSKFPDLVTTIETVSPSKHIQFSYINLEQTVNYYEKVIADGDEASYNYWYLGLAYLLQERELDAQATWFIPFEGASELESVTLNSDLLYILDRSAAQEFIANNLDNAWLISQCLRDLDPTHINNLLRSIMISIELERFTPELLVEWEANEILSTSCTAELDLDLLSRILRSLLPIFSEYTYSFIKECLLLDRENSTNSIKEVVNILVEISHQIGANSFMIEILEFCRTLQPRNFDLLNILCRTYSNLGSHEEAILIGRSLSETCDLLPDKIRATYTSIVMYLNAGDWQTAYPIFHRYQELIEKFSTEHSDVLTLTTNQGLIISTKLFPYTEDRPAYYRKLQNKIAKIYLENDRASIEKYDIEPSTLIKHPGTIRIGYLGSTLRSHSVGWLSRWLWQHHDLNKFQIFTYCINQSSEDPFYQKWFRNRSNMSYCLTPDPDRIAAQIRADNIDILIDLDSLTLNITCKVLAAKPAPIQVSWLGWDATGLPTVDYFIADPYVLPGNAQDYYREKIWQLPQTYLAVNGFEIGIPTLKRQDLDIPDDAIVYWSGQRGFKRHPDTVRAQMRILKGVPNSYFIVKGDTNPTIIQEFFGEIATEEGVEFDRLRFVGSVVDEPTHRANLAIADIVLDTFPYNGATTTLETLWMGIPMVTQVGQQFAARNSYTFMLNAGITEGIAWSQEEYIEWGIKLGLDRDLRDKIAGKLRSGRTNAPVWNAKQFTLDMEEAYRQMWAIHQGKSRQTGDYSNN